ncbi:hypothetical protein SAMN05216559_1203 [Halomicrobium zhouii]|uniref:Uncharacterized protein n=1 Tax=Halomicrobium zhouii TaxID=767519 RepID=A0A1I6KP56_9EURY|nr:hypothetical protein [Halomicrobium zhouii]SFR93023.1 hypothetical protein SAMN05216559_1203 [Halomicrobium zhouii]
MGERFHFVCHECTEEGVYEDRDEALDVKNDHVAATEHRVSMENISERPA